MSTDAESPGTEPSPPAVVQWGGGAGDAPPRRSSALRGLGTDRRLVPLVTVLGAAAVLLSLISEWQLTVVDFGDSEIGNRMLRAGVGDLAGWAPGYLGGLLLLAGAMTLLMYGPPAVRRPARLVGLSTGGALLALLAAIVADLADRSRLNNLLILTLPEEQVAVTYGRGLWCALAGVGATTLAAYLAGRHLPSDPLPYRSDASGAGPDRPAPDGTAVDGTADGGGPVADFSWRRPDDEPPPDAPLGLTVQSTAPFARPVDDRDRPT